MTADRSDNCIIVGLTGSSGSGKSEAAKILTELGAHVIDADAISHEITDRRDVLDELTGAFGDWVTDGGGLFNRALVSQKAFSDNVFLLRLTAITHKYVINEIYARVDAIKKSLTDGGVIVIDAPLPVKEGFLDIADTVWVIDAPGRQRLERVMKRDGLGRGSAEARFSSQMSDDEYKALADVVFENSSGLNKLRDELECRYNSLAREAPSGAEVI